MAAILLSFAPSTPHPNSRHRLASPAPANRPKIDRLRRFGENPARNSSAEAKPEPENALLKAAWYGSELLGIAASFFRSPASAEAPARDFVPAGDGSGAFDRGVVVETIKEDYQRSYFVTGASFLSCLFIDGLAILFAFRTIANVYRIVLAMNRAHK